MNETPPTGSAAAAAPNAPWYAGPLFHLVTGILVLGAGFGLLHYGQATEGAAAIGSGLTFLGVGAGRATATG